jgi:hypothetical protein
LKVRLASSKGASDALPLSLDGDEGPASDVVGRSITELCMMDCRGDAQVLARWLANKTRGDFHRRIGSAHRSVCVAVGGGGRLVAVGMVAWSGEIPAELRAPEASLKRSWPCYRDRQNERVLLQLFGTVTVR